MHARSRSRRRSWDAVIVVLFTLAVLLGSIPVSAEPGVPPYITGIASTDQDIDLGETRTYDVLVTGYDTGVRGRSREPVSPQP